MVCFLSVRPFIPSLARAPRCYLHRRGISAPIAAPGRVAVHTPSNTRGMPRALGESKEALIMYSILYIIGAIVVIIVVLKLLGLY